MNGGARNPLAQRPSGSLAKLLGKWSVDWFVTHVFHHKLWAGCNVGDVTYILICDIPNVADFDARTISPYCGVKSRV